MSTTTRNSLFVISAGIATGVALWAVFRLAGVGLNLNDASSMSSVGIGDVLVASALAGFAAWGVHAWMLRRSLARYWYLVGSAALTISLIGPSWFADGWSVLPLIVMHFAVGWVLIDGLGWLAAPEAGRACARDHLLFLSRRHEPHHEAS